MNQKIKAAFFSEKALIDNAYNETVKQKLCETLTFVPACYTAEMFEKNVEMPELSDVECIFSTWGMAALDEEKIKRYLPKLKAIFYAAGTVQYFAKPFMKNGVRIFSAWGANAVPVAEVTVAEIILANKGFYQNLHRGGEAGWAEHDEGKPYPGNYNTNIGIIGAGMIGTLVIEYLKNYRLNVFVFDPFMTRQRAEALGVKKVEALPELFEKCHVISNHLANNPQTVGMIDKSCFEKMDSTAVFINTGRGQQVVESDLIEALKKQPTRSAVLDVTYPEPPDNDSELYLMKNVFLTPHTAGSLGNEVQRMGEYMYEEYIAFVSGKENKYEVSEKMLATMA